jgi:ATP-dependent RNA helicase RhlE
VQRINQLIHPVGRGKKKALLAHIIQEHNWSQVLVFTRTKFGANNVATFLVKNNINAMALHGNKSQAARTQALAGFKSGDIRALVATDIAARGIDIDDLPHVVNYDIPNVCEDYIHRIGRTGRAGAEGQAVNLVCLDEEGFMQAIERFTKQDIPVQIIEGFMPEPGEKAEPIAMGRQTIWGGAGKAPGRDVMQAAAKAARTEMMQRVRDGKSSTSQRGNRASSGRAAQAEGSSGYRGNAGPAGGRNSGGSQRHHEPISHATAVDLSLRSPAQRAGQGRGSNAQARSGSNQGQPDPMRTSVDMMAERSSRRGAGFGGANRGGGSGGRSGGFGGGSNGPRGPRNSGGSFNR